eukprot:TRINITY_DN10431_c0_g1_i1.p1 TRINITY_DN10431_c0_g1~~TRINITY_DN10431_c0_g1_i1.p1  ORF type:complete len:194 (-),score=27.20 TRINITY_DN10431_c0_g1_i1:176-757(-)
MGKRRYIQQVPPNTSEYIYIPKATSGNDYDRNAIHSGMFGNRLSQSQLDEIFERIEKVTKKLSLISTIIFLVWLVIAVALIVLFALFFMKRRDDPESLDPTIGLILGATFFGSLIVMVIAAACVAKSFYKKLQDVIDQANHEKLHANGLHLYVGPKHRYLTLHLNYAGQQEYPGIAVGGTGYNQNQQPFLAQN